jgi:hypothetical protein
VASHLLRSAWRGPVAGASPKRRSHSLVICFPAVQGWLLLLVHNLSLLPYLRGAGGHRWPGQEPTTLQVACPRAVLRPGMWLPYLGVLVSAAQAYHAFLRTITIPMAPAVFVQSKVCLPTLPLSPPQLPP